ncbi:MAG: hypothetical protein H0T76_12595, partial [Nannocystis sp.]
ARIDQAHRALDQERERGDAASGERDSLRGELVTLRRQLDSESQAHARARQAHDLLQSRVTSLEGEAGEQRRDAVRHGQRAEQAIRDIDAMRRDLAREQAAHAATRTRLVELQETQRGAAAERSAEREAHAAAEERLRRADIEISALAHKLTGDQTALLEASDRSETLAKELVIATDRLTLLRRQLQDETAAHAATRRQYEVEQAEAEARRRRGRGKGIISALGGAAAVGVAVILRRR